MSRGYSNMILRPKDKTCSELKRGESAPKTARTSKSKIKAPFVVVFFFFFQYQRRNLPRAHSWCSNSERRVLSRSFGAIEKTSVPCKARFGGEWLNFPSHQYSSLCLSQSQLIFGQKRYSSASPSPYSPDLAPCDFFYSQKWRLTSKGLIMKT